MVCGVGNSNEKKQMSYIDANNFHGFGKDQSLPYDEIKIDKDVEKKYILNTSETSGVGCFCWMWFIISRWKKGKTKYSQTCLENKIIPRHNFSDYKNEMKPTQIIHKTNYTQSRKLFFDWTDEEDSLIRYKLLKF